MKKIGFIFLLMLVSVCAVFAQQITRFGVVDTGLVYTTYFRETAAVRNYDTKKIEFQAEITKFTEELKELQLEKLEYERNNNTSSAMLIESEITQKADFLTEYTWAKNIELETLRENLANSDAFYENLYKVISDIAEEEGYSVILNLQEDAILWYSPAVDITSTVIDRLQ